MIRDFAQMLPVTMSIHHICSLIKFVLPPAESLCAYALFSSPLLRYYMQSSTELKTRDTCTVVRQGLSYGHR